MALKNVRLGGASGGDVCEGENAEIGTFVDNDCHRSTDQWGILACC